MSQDLTVTAERPRTDATSVATPVARARAAVDAAQRAFPGWSATPPSDRSVLLQRAAELLMDHQAEIAALVTEETCGTRFWGMFNVKLAAEMLAYYAAQTDVSVHDEDIPSHLPGKRAMAVRQPVGVVVGIAPWNAPVILGVRAVAAPLAYGNTVVLKPRSSALARTR
jgi:acyl-CoA reductase-like NAD-dependent aldehyde dehydrogenase